MPTVEIDGIRTRYEVAGSGPPLLMFSPGGFDSSLRSWTSVGIYRRLNLLPQLAQHFTCITFDRRESGESGGRLERIAWGHYVRQAKGLLEHLDIGSAHLMGGCVGCSTVAAFAVAHPESTRSMVLYSPAGGAKYRMKQHERFVRHLAFAAEHGLSEVVELARSTSDGFSKDARVGPWVTVLRTDESFAAEYASTEAGRYQTIVTGLARLMFDRDSVPGVEPEDLMVLDIPALVVPGEDDSHAPSAAQFLHEVLPQAQLWDVPVVEQTELTAPSRIIEFLNGC